MNPAPGDHGAGYDAALVERTLAEARADVWAALEELIAERRATGYGPLYDLVVRYPFREGKGLRPAICLSACRAVGGRTDQALLAATALELFHNAFLVHDDVEDGSDLRRGQATLLASHGVPVAVNVGDATNVLALGPLLDTVEAIGVRKALLVLRDVERMARESVEGQAIELGWIAEEEFALTDDAYARMAYKKTCWYTVIAPLRIGIICGTPRGAPADLEALLAEVIELGFLAGVAFQVQDDLLNLVADEQVYGKELWGDLWEGKRTVMLLHFMRTAPDENRHLARQILTTPRAHKQQADITWLGRQMAATGSIEHGRQVALDYCARALTVQERVFAHLPDTPDRRFLCDILHYVIHHVK